MNSIKQSSSLLRRLFENIKINQLQLPNRILMSSLHLNLDSFPDQYERMAHFYAVRAQTNIGLIVTSGCSPNLAGNSSAGGFALDCDALIPKHQYITAAVHRAGGRIALQILHFGRESFHGKLVSASSVKLKSSLFTPRSLTTDEIWETITDYATTARRALEAGYDAVELIFSQGFFVHQFLSLSTNKREDEWGGCFDNRAHIAVEIAKTVRKTVGAHFPLIFRIPCLDLLDEGLQPEETIILIKKLQPYGIDLLNVSIGWHESTVPTIAMVVPQAGFSPVAAYIRQQFPELKIAVSNRINDPRLAEQLLIDQVADVIAMGRPFLADPFFVEKARNNSFNKINTCIACNQACLDYVFTGRPVGCSVNPECGLQQEGHYPPLRHYSKVAVVGGGIAGMTTALFLAKRGADVTLFEQDSKLGGQLNLASKIPGKEEFQETIRYYLHALRSLNVEIRCNVLFDKVNLENEAWTHLVLATGSIPKKQTEIAGINQAHVYNYSDILNEECPVSFPVIIIGGGGVACDVAKYVITKTKRRWIDSGNYLEPWVEKFKLHQMYPPQINHLHKEKFLPVTILQRSSKKLAHKIGRTTRWILMQELKRAGIKAYRGTSIQEITAEGVKIIDKTKKLTRDIPAATVILAIGQMPQVELINSLRNQNLPYSLVGAVTDENNTNITTATVHAYQLAMNWK